MSCPREHLRVMDDNGNCLAGLECPFTEDCPGDLNGETITKAVKATDGRCYLAESWCNGRTWALIDDGENVVLCEQGAGSPPRLKLPSDCFWTMVEKLQRVTTP